MKISFLGTGAAEGIPAMFCDCPFCKSVREAGFAQFRTRSQVLIDGDLSIDFPPEAYAHSLRFNVDLSTLKYALITHSHMDHFYAHDFILRGYKYASADFGELSIYGNEEVAKVYAECTRREMRYAVSEKISVNVVHAFQSFTMGEYRVLTLPAQHGTKEEALLYYVEKAGKGYLHLYDTGALNDRAVEFLKDNGAHADLIAFDCTFLDASPQTGTRHMCIEDDMFILSRLKSVGVADDKTKCVITHFSHNCTPTPEKLAAVEKQYGVTSAYDGFTVEI